MSGENFIGFEHLKVMIRDIGVKVKSAANSPSLSKKSSQTDLGAAASLQPKYLNSGDQ
jgi:hypothetical protein